MMEFRRAVESDLEGIMKIIRDAKKSLKAANIDQWQNGYPDAAAIREDIGKGQSYIMTEGSKIIATAAITFLEEKDYKGIYEGRWGGSETYAVIHRLAILTEMKGKGLADQFLEQIEAFVREQQYSCIRTDTHEDNVRMQRLLVRKGYHFRGLIYIGGTDKRRAFEKILTGERTEETRTEEAGTEPEDPIEEA